MATHSRNPDFIQRHARLDRRIRDLETGVHPVSADNDFAGDWPLTLIEPAEPGGPVQGHWPGGADYLDNRPRWRKRAGIAMLSGTLTITDPTLAAVEAGKVYGSIPTAGRPATDMTFWATADHAPYITTVTVGEDGALTVYGGELPAPTAGELTLVYLHGIAYPVG